MQTDLLHPVLIAVAWPYVNGAPHVGHYAGALLPADIVARYFRLRGHKVLMISGSDCYGTPITVEADNSGLTPLEVANKYHPLWQARFERLGMSYDLYTSTLTENHKNVVQEVFLKLLKAGYISKGVSQQYYSAKDNRFLPDRYVEGTCPLCGFIESRSDQCDKCGSVIPDGSLLNPISKLSGGKAELKETQHYFLEYQKFQPFLEDYVEKNSGKWRKWVRAETLKWLKEGLKPRAISRDLDWGIPIPTDRMSSDELIDHVDSKRLYVWFDAVIGYLSASIEWASHNQVADKDNTELWHHFWKNKDAVHYYFMGKDNLVFHTLFWPAYLHGFDADLHLPDQPAINQYLTFEGEKFSKSRGIIVDPSELAEKYTLDGLRFYLATIMPENSDADFSISGIQDAINGKLVAKIGNFINRTANLASELTFEDFIPCPEIVKAIETAHDDCENFIEVAQIRRYTERLLTLSEFSNGYISDQAPWLLRKSDHPDANKKFYQVMGNCAMLTLSLLTISAPIIINAHHDFKELTGIHIKSWPKDIISHLITQLKSWTIKSKPNPLFKRAE